MTCHKLPRLKSAKNAFYLSALTSKATYNVLIGFLYWVKQVKSS